MMRIKLAFAFVLFWAISYVYAGEVSIGAWAQNILLETLSPSYRDTPAQIQATQKNYLPEAWDPMEQFFHNKRVEINAKKLTLHPMPLSAPQVRETCDDGLTLCWQVTQSFAIPEFSIKVDISLRVIPGSEVKDAPSPFVIQSLSINLQDNT